MRGRLAVAIPSPPVGPTSASAQPQVAPLRLAELDQTLDVTGETLRAREVNTRLTLPAVELVGVTGERLIADLVTIPQFAIGGLILRNLPVAFVDAPPFALFGLADTPAVMLGTDVLQAFRRVSLDFRRRKVRFSLR